MDLDPVVSANTRFGFKLFSQLAVENPEENLFISPASISVALTLLYNGAVGQTREALARTLEVEGMDLEEINRASAALLEALQSADPEVRLAIANALWAARAVPLRPAFVRSLRRAYNAHAAEVDFSDPNTIKLINDWIREETAGKITSILADVDPHALLVLVNAITFKGRWSSPFDEEHTRDGPFTLLDGSRKTLPMMSQSGSYHTFRGTHFQAVRLPYGEKRTALYVFLPERSASLEEFQRRLSVDTWNGWMARFHRMEGSVVLPRFKLDYEKQLNETLTALGMGVAFSPEADFSAASETPSSISEVIHKTFVEINEEGTEAAAATAVAMMRTMMIPQKTFRMIVDRPFFCAIRDDRTGVLLFMGSIVEPGQAARN